MAVTCPLGMIIPAVPVSEHNPVLSANWLIHGISWSLALVHPVLMIRKEPPLKEPE
jgi:hypothetical protein